MNAKKARQLREKARQICDPAQMGYEAINICKRTIGGKYSHTSFTRVLKARSFRDTYQKLKRNA